MSLASTSLSSSEKDTFVEHLFKPESDSSDSASSLHKRSCKPSGMVANHCLTMRGREEIERERERGEEKVRIMCSLQGNAFIHVILLEG